MSKQKNGKNSSKRYPKRPEGVYHRWMPYDAAKLTVQSVGGLTSREKFWRWHDDVKPYYIPKMPYRVYKEEWKTWGDFLGVDNAWDGWDRKRKKDLGIAWMPYWEAVRTIQKMGLKSKDEYLEAYERGDINVMIPKMPERTYGDDWTGWGSFLGKGLSAKVESADNVVGIVCLCTSTILPPNVIEIIIAPEGRGQLQDKLDSRTDLRPFKKYVWESHLWPRVKGVMDHYGIEQSPGVYLFSNVNAIVFEFDNLLLMYR